MLNNEPAKGQKKAVEDQSANYGTEECERIYQEVKASNTRAFLRLRDKCKWEGMGLLAVIREWGDPRTWPK